MEEEGGIEPNPKPFRISNRGFQPNMEPCCHNLLLCVTILKTFCHQNNKNMLITICHHLSLFVKIVISHYLSIFVTICQCILNERSILCIRTLIHTNTIQQCVKQDISDFALICLVLDVCLRSLNLHSLFIYLLIYKYVRISNYA